MSSGATFGITCFVIFPFSPIHFYRKYSKIRYFHLICLQKHPQIMFKCLRRILCVTSDPSRLISMIFEIWPLLRGRENHCLWSQFYQKWAISPLISAMIDLNQCLNTLNHECYKSHGLRGFVGRVGPLGAVGVVCPASPVGSYTNPWVPLVSCLSLGIL